MRLMAGSYRTLLGGAKAALVITDPPYNVAINGHAGGKGQIQHRDFAMGCGEMTSAAFTTFLITTFEHLAANSTDGSIHYTFMDWRHMREMLEAGHAVYSELKISASGTRPMGVWASFTGPSTNWSLSGNRERPLTSITLSLASTGATAPTSGIMPGSIRFGRSVWTSCRCTQR